MNDSWETVFSTQLPHRAELAKALLLSHQIPAVIVSRSSSSYPVMGLGKTDVHVPSHQLDMAKDLLNDDSIFS